MPLRRLMPLLLALALSSPARAAAPDTHWTTYQADACWSDTGGPRALLQDGRIWAGWVSSDGSVRIGAMDPATGLTVVTSMQEQFDRNAHAAPALLPLPDGRLMVFFCRRGQGDIQLRTTLRPGDLSKWSPARPLGLVADGEPGLADPIPVMLSREQYAIHLFWRGADGNPAASVSRDVGATWSRPRPLLATAPDAARPDSFRVQADGQSRILLAFADATSVYFTRYGSGAFWRADGTRIGDATNLPLDPAACDRVLQHATNESFVVWDVADGPGGQPALLYSRRIPGREATYHMVHWDGQQWSDHAICTVEELDQRPPGGMCFDAASSATVILSRPVTNRFEIERWTVSEAGPSWSAEPVTAGSERDNIRPVSIRSTDGKASHLLWLNVRRYDQDGDFDTDLLVDRVNPTPRAPTTPLAPGVIRATLESVADWQLAHPAPYRKTDWTQGALYAGIMALAGLSPEPRFREALKAIGEQNAWKPGPQVYHADDHAVGQLYVDLFELYRDPRMLVPLRERFDAILAQPATNSLAFEGPWDQRTRRWSWCDALFMGPPAWIRLYRATGDRRYRDFALAEWANTSEQLYDPAEHLFLRDSTHAKRREANGRKTFQSRGNGWALAGLARTLQALQAGDPDRKRLVRQFQSLADALRTCQQADGLWRPGLLDPGSYPLPESSGSALITFGLAWGLNQGVLDRTVFEPVARRAWDGLVHCVEPEGRLTHVQPIGADPKSFDTHHSDGFGAGAFLLAGSEVYRLALVAAVKQAPVTVRNPIDMRRGPETVELAWSEVAARLGGVPDGDLAVLDAASSRLLDHQALDEDADGKPDRLLFQAELLAGETRTYLLLGGLSPTHQPRPVRSASGRSVADPAAYAWSNDLVSFALRGAGTNGAPGSGVAVCPDPRALRDAGSTRGCGGLAIKAGDELLASAGFAAAKQIAGGAIRTIVEVTYDAWPAGEQQVREVRRIALDRESHFNRMESRLEAEPAGELLAAIGLAAKPGAGAAQGVAREGWLAYSELEPAEGKPAHLALVCPGGLNSMPHTEHWLALRQVKPGETLLYHAGAAWSRSAFPTAEAWQRHVQLFAWALSHPLEARWDMPAP